MLQALNSKHNQKYTNKLRTYALFPYTHDCFQDGAHFERLQREKIYIKIRSLFISISRLEALAHALFEEKG